MGSSVSQCVIWAKEHGGLGCGWLKGVGTVARGGGGRAPGNSKVYGLNSSEGWYHDREGAE